MKRKRGRPKTDNTKQRVIALLTEEEIRILDDYARKQNRTRANAAAVLIMQALKNVSLTKKKEISNE